MPHKRMNQRHEEGKSAKHELRSLDAFRRRFYPVQISSDDFELPDADDVGEKLAKESLDRLQAALAVK